MASFTGLPHPMHLDEGMCLGLDYGVNVKQSNTAQALEKNSQNKLSTKPRAIIGPKLTTLVNFDVFTGSSPEAGLVQDSNGNFYGTTFLYGASGAAGRGTIYRLKPDGTFNVLVNFTGANGGYPLAALILAANGNFYGVCSGSGNGTVFRMRPNGALKTLNTFSTASIDGRFPKGRLVQTSNGNFFGTTSSLGTGNRGTVFKMRPDGTLTTIASFSGTNGAFPIAGLVEGSNGNFYGTTERGGTSTNCSAFGGCGTVFKIKANGTFTTLVNFDRNNGEAPQAELLLGSDGNFYGTTRDGGTNNKGTVFKMKPNGTLKTLVNFSGTGTSPGAQPYAGLIQGSDGNFYGTTRGGGTFNKGTVFQMKPNGKLSTLVNFDGTNGNEPRAELIQAADGNFYGTTYRGGINDKGTVFKLTLD
jgi:uncharacterized repeat protein (TIGR03803 family)